MHPEQIQTSLGLLTELELLGNQGGNSSIYVGTLNGERVVYKSSSREDAVERVTKEYRNLAKISSRFSDIVPTPLALNSLSTGFIMTFERGNPPKVISYEVSNSMLHFLERLMSLGDPSNPIVSYEVATDNVIEDIFGIAQLTKRYEQICRLIHAHDLETFHSMRVFIERYEHLCNQVKLMHSLKVILSPSDFGIHNILLDEKRVSKCKFVDFEYLGWDRPEKLVSDTILHPKNVWDNGVVRSFLDGAIKLYDLDLEYLQILLFFSKLNWTLIGIRRLIDSDNFSTELLKCVQTLEKLDFASGISLDNTLEILGMR